MPIADYFKPIEAWSADQVRRFLREHSPEEYNLVDVRQPAEYERGHLPGSRLIPMAELETRAGEIDPSRPTIAY
ncbi:MAG: rhodanese-like domain-containing protein [bacterium]|nr:MAG: rhodanese-like domain-containing protein [bacterium]